MNKKEQLNEDLKKIIESYCVFPMGDDSWFLELYRSDIVNMISEIKDTLKKDIVDEQLQKIILSYCEFPDNTYVLEFYRADVDNIVEEIVEALED
jgi:Holliday junction resolvase RusA-like endonuclease